MITLFVYLQVFLGKAMPEVISKSDETKGDPWWRALYMFGQCGTTVFVILIALPTMYVT